MDGHKLMGMSIECATTFAIEAVRVGEPHRLCASVGLRCCSASSGNSRVRLIGVDVQDFVLQAERHVVNMSICDLSQEALKRKLSMGTRNGY